jgi:hypothetical protein
MKYILLSILAVGLVQFLSYGWDFLGYSPLPGLFDKAPEPETWSGGDNFLAAADFKDLRFLCYDFLEDLSLPGLHGQAPEAGDGDNGRSASADFSAILSLGRDFLEIDSPRAIDAGRPGLGTGVRQDGLLTLGEDWNWNNNEIIGCLVLYSSWILILLGLFALDDKRMGKGRPYFMAPGEDFPVLDFPAQREDWIKREAAYSR